MKKRLTLAECRRQGAGLVAFTCIADPDIGYGRRGGLNCHHTGTMPIDDAMARLGADRSLDDIRARCTACGRDHVHVRAIEAPRPPPPPGHFPGPRGT